MGRRFLLQGIFPTQRSNLSVLWLLHWQVDSLPLCHWGRTFPVYWALFICYLVHASQNPFQVVTITMMGHISEIQKQDLIKMKGLPPVIQQGSGGGGCKPRQSNSRAPNPTQEAPWRGQGCQGLSVYSQIPQGFCQKNPCSDSGGLG